MGKRGFDTLKIHAGYDARQHQDSVAVPIYPTAAFDFGTVRHADLLTTLTEPGYLYTRLGNPTTAVLEERVAELDGGKAAVAFASGMAAISMTILAVTGGHGRVLSTKEIYGGMFDLEADVLPTLGIRFDLLDYDSSLSAWENAITEETRAIYVESISNPNVRLLDYEALADIAHRHGIPFIVDNTFATPYLFQPIRHGADIVVYSTTKGLNGHGNAIGGVVVEAGTFQWKEDRYPQFYKRHWVTRDLEDEERSILEALPETPLSGLLRLKYLAYFGASLSPYDAQLILIGIETLSERLKKEIESTRAVLSYLSSRKDAVSWLHYPEQPDSPDRALAGKYLPKGAGDVFSFGLKGTEEQVAALIDSVEIFSYQANVGDAKSLIVNSPKITHGELRPAELADAGIPAESVRISIGLEDADDLIADLEQALEKAGFPKGKGV